MVTHEEIVAFMKAEIEQLSRDCQARPKRTKHLDERDDDYAFVEENLDRWGDRKVPKSTH